MNNIAAFSSKCAIVGCRFFLREAPANIDNGSLKFPSIAQCWYESNSLEKRLASRMTKYGYVPVVSVAAEPDRVDHDGVNDKARCARLISLLSAEEAESHLCMFAFFT